MAFYIFLSVLLSLAVNFLANKINGSKKLLYFFYSCYTIGVDNGTYTKKTRYRWQTVIAGFFCYLALVIQPILEQFKHDSH